MFYSVEIVCIKVAVLDATMRGQFDLPLCTVKQIGCGVNGAGTAYPFSSHKRYRECVVQSRNCQLRAFMVILMVYRSGWDSPMC